MKPILFLLVFLVLLLPYKNSIFVYSQTISKDSVAVKRDDEIEKLLAIIRDKDLLKTGSAKVIAAIDKLGELKSEEAIGDLVQLLTLDRGAKYFDTENPPSGGIITASSIYPAVQALYRIGTASLPALLKVIENKEPDALASKNAWWVIFILNREEPPEAIKLLKKAAGETTSSIGAERLLKAAKKIEELVEKSNK